MEKADPVVPDRATARDALPISWSGWAWLWSPFLVAGVIWSAVSLGPQALLATAIMFGIFTATGSWVLHERGRRVSWSAAATAALAGTSFAPLLIAAPGPTFVALALMVLSCPWFGALGATDTVVADLRAVPDWELERRWTAAGVELERTADPAVVAELAERRSALLDELLRRQRRGRGGDLLSDTNG